MTVVVIGAGPVGMLLSAELARHGVDVVVLERRAEPGAGSRAVGVHPTALGAMEASGATELLLAHARRVREGEARSRGKVLGTVPFAALGSRHPFVATLPQAATEAALADTARRWGAPEPERGKTVTAVRPLDGGVEIRFDGSEPLRADLVVIAGGTRARALVPGGGRRRTYRDRYLMTDAADAGDDGDRAIVHLDPDGVLESFPLPEGRRRYVAWMPSAEAGTDDEWLLRDAVARRTGSDAAAAAITGATGFGVGRALVRSLRAGPVLTIGDAAHEVSPIGGQGMNLGLIDAVTLAPLLARWIRAGEAPTEIDAWARRRRRAAALSGRIAAANTVLGRPSHAVGRWAVAGALAVGAGALARAYGMDFDPDAARFRAVRG